MLGIPKGEAARHPILKETINLGLGQHHERSGRVWAASMLSSRLYKAQVELQSHRCWLNSYVAGSQSGYRSRLSPSRSSPFQHHGEPRNTTLPIWQHTTQRFASSRSFATNVRSRKGKVKSESPSEYPVLLKLRQAVDDVRIKDVAKLYSSLKHKSIFGKSDFKKIAQCLHHCLRSEKRSTDAKKRREDLEELLAFAERLVDDVVKGNLYPNRQAHVHLIGFFKESGVRDAGVRFWKWLEQQEDQYVNEDVYGAAIELLAVNGSSLAELEDLYQQALNRFPGNFSAYHLSPEAIVPTAIKRLR